MSSSQGLNGLTHLKESKEKDLTISNKKLKMKRLTCNFLRLLYLLATIIHLNFKYLAEKLTWVTIFFFFFFLEGGLERAKQVHNSCKSLNPHESIL